MQRAFSIPHVPVAIGTISLAPRRASLHGILREARRLSMLSLRRLIDFMACGGGLS